jgi:hypothetical protein
MIKRKKKPVVPTKFTAGDKVRVKLGIMDADYPDIPLGGWTGTISEVHEDGVCTIRWSRETLAAIHPVVKNRCEKDGTALEEYLLSSDDLEADPGGPVNIEQPTEITTKPLSPKDQDDRIRMVFDLTSNDPLPELDDKTLEVYRQYLSKTLAFPFQAEHESEDGQPEQVEVIGLGNPGEEHGILCEARIEDQIVTLPLSELEEATPNRQLVEDYCYWFWNWR